MDSESDSLIYSGGSNIQTGTLTQHGIMFCQINLQKSKEATGNLAQLLVEWSTSLFFVLFQEPWAPKGNMGLSTDGLTVAGTNPRARI
jgi:hypothetical protein